MGHDIKIFVQASCYVSATLDNDEPIGNGGYGVVISTDGKRTDEFSGGHSHTTNARMDIIGITKALQRVTNPSSITFYLSNGNVIDTLTKGWLENWKRKGFKKRKHVELWVALDKVIQDSNHTLSFQHSTSVKNHPDFLLADSLAKAMSGKKNLPLDRKPEDAKGGLFAVTATTTEELTPGQPEENTPILDSICVDASTTGNPGPTEYRAIDTQTRQLLFEQKLPEATNNIGEFLAIVHALALYKKDGKPLKVIYSDSQIAISWVRQRKCKTSFDKTEANAAVFGYIDRALKWLNTNSYDTKILKWNTGAWGEIPADYGRK